MEKNDDGTISVELLDQLQPLPASVSANKRKYLEENEPGEIVLRPAYAGDLIDIDGVDGDNKRALKLIELLSGVPFQNLRRLSLRDLGRVTEAMNEQMGKS